MHQVDRSNTFLARDQASVWRQQRTGGVNSMCVNVDVHQRGKKVMGLVMDIREKGMHTGKKLSGYSIFSLCTEETSSPLILTSHVEG